MCHCVNFDISCPVSPVHFIILQIQKFNCWVLNLFIWTLKTLDKRKCWQHKRHFTVKWKSKTRNAEGCRSFWNKLNIGKKKMLTMQKAFSSKWKSKNWNAECCISFCKKLNIGNRKMLRMQKAFSSKMKIQKLKCWVLH